jgi:trimethylamine--corrinoid protein Co-methyltransferase
MLDFENGFSIQKLVFDDQVCGAALRLRAGINRPDPQGVMPLIEELLREGHLLIAGHTRRHLRQEISFPSSIVDRVGHARWIAEGASTLQDRAAAAVEALEQSAAESHQPRGIRDALTGRMQAAAREAGMDRLPMASCAR